VYVRTFSYETVTADNRGSIISRKQKQVNGYAESINGLPLEMVEIPGGTFLMGTGEGEKEQIIREYAKNVGGQDISQTQRSNARQRASGWVMKEMPQHIVRVKGFFMGKYEVTQAQWRAVARLPRISIDLQADPSQFKGDELPVEGIRWDEAVEFCQRLSKTTSREYRLPSEAEWEYAARGGRTTQFPLGDAITTDLANFWGDEPFGEAPIGVFRETTSRVGSLSVANEFGLYDVSGNVWEWCADHWHDSYAGAPSDGTPWLAGRSSDDHVVRGGSWDDAASYCRSASRGRDAESRRATNRYGFRVAVSVR
jgi:formylglycine-generating enzyme required for sulfatase activity